MNFHRLKELADSFTSWRIPGCALEVRQGGERVYSCASGFSDRENGIEMTGETLMYMYSASKPVTCAAALTLWEKGLFLLSDPVYGFLPDWSDMRVLVRDENGGEKTVPVNRPVTVGDLFTMTSGLDYNVNLPSFSAKRDELSPRCGTVELMNALGRDPLLFQPGEKWMYGLSHDVLGAIVEVVSGSSLKDYAKKAIFEPLEMENTFYGGEIPSGLAVQYRFDDTSGVYVPTDNRNGFAFGSDYYSGGAGIISTVEDMSKFAGCLSMKGKTPTGDRILSSATVDLMKENALNGEQLKGFDWQALAGYGYGLGVRVLIDKAKAQSPSSLGEFGWTGAAGAYMLCDTERKLSLFYAHHMLNNQEAYTAPRLRNVLYSCLD